MGEALCGVESPRSFLQETASSDHMFSVSISPCLSCRPCLSPLMPGSVLVLGSQNARCDTWPLWGKDPWYGSSTRLWTEGTLGGSG